MRSAGPVVPRADDVRLGILYMIASVFLFAFQNAIGKWLAQSYPFRVALYLDQGTTDAQHQALLDVYTGKLGGPVAELAKLVGEVVSVERASIRFDVEGGRGTLTISDVSHAELEPYKGPDGATTTLTNTIGSAPVRPWRSAMRCRAEKRSCHWRFMSAAGC